MAAPAPEPQRPGIPSDAAAARQAVAEQTQDQVLQQILGAELPGQGYLFPDDPETRQGQLVKTTPQFVRDNLLRAIEVQAFAAQLPLDEEKPSDIGKLILAMAQAYLLLDPTLDTEGVPVEGEGSKAHATAKAAHEFPPRVQENPAEAASKAKHEPQSEALNKTRGQQPRPQPRVGS